MRELPLSKGFVAIVDDVDFERASQHKWTLKGLSARYAFRFERLADGRRRSVRLHNFILSPPAGLEVDHINRDGLDCRRANLRLATRHENSMNRSGWARSGFKGVHADGPRWVARLRHGDRLLYLGSFATAELAARAYDAAATARFGDFAYCNFPRGTK